MAATCVPDSEAGSVWGLWVGVMEIPKQDGLKNRLHTRLQPLLDGRAGIFS